MAANQAEERTSKRARVDATLTNIADEWKCAITGELVVDPCIAEDGHVYERAADGGHKVVGGEHEDDDKGLVVGLGVECPAFGKDALHAGVDPINPGHPLGVHVRVAGLGPLMDPASLQDLPFKVASNVSIPEACGVVKDGVVTRVAQEGAIIDCIATMNKMDAGMTVEENPDLSAFSAATCSAATAAGTEIASME